MALPEGYVYRDGAYWYQGAGPFIIGDDDIADLAPHEVSAGPADSSYAYHAGGYWRPGGYGPYLRDLTGNFFLLI